MDEEVVNRDRNSATVEREATRNQVSRDPMSLLGSDHPVDTPLEACEDNHSIEDLSVRLGSIQQELQRLIKGKASVAANVMGPVNQNYSGNTTLHSVTSFAVPTKVLKHLPIERGYYERDFTAFDGNGDQWNFVMAIRQTGDYQKPFLRPPKWHEFVVAHGLSGMIMEENMG
ncbi:hypothetical protein GH714_011579 [Hevea brasiliensis]|uniref:TF-B3 domain-containing protein n=1 Tax=Hevea brasiliensis TaxID=3981 RepID=A0A6A6M7Z1_HEVBR|nr:hypothetical protein GH714_011579 [Hevea brasiliensis]